MVKQILIFTLLVLTACRDKITQNIYQPGDNLQTDDIDRVNDLVRRGICKIKSVENPTLSADGAGDNSGNANADLVEIQGATYSVADVKTALGEIGAGVAANAGVKGVSKKLSELTEDQIAQLQAKLNNVTTE